MDNNNIASSIKVDGIDVITYGEILKNEAFLKKETGKSYFFLRQIKLQLMLVQSRLYNKSFKRCCMEHLGVIATGEGSEDAKMTDKLFILQLMLEWDVFGDLIDV